MKSQDLPGLLRRKLCECHVKTLECTLFYSWYSEVLKYQVLFTQYFVASLVLNQVLQLFISCVWSIHYLKMGTIKFRTLIQLPNLRWRKNFNSLATKTSLSLRCREIPLSTQHSDICNIFPLSQEPKPSLSRHTWSDKGEVHSDYVNMSSLCSAVDLDGETAVAEALTTMLNTFQGFTLAWLLPGPGC